VGFLRKLWEYEVSVHTTAQNILARHLPISVKGIQLIFSILVVGLGSWMLLIFFGVTPVQENLVYLGAAIILTVACYLLARTWAPIELEETHKKEIGHLQQKCDLLKNELELLNTPSVSLELWGIQEDIEGIQTVFLEVTGQSVQPVRVEVFGTAVSPPYSSAGKYILHLASGIASPFSVHRGETHRSIPVLEYNPIEIGPSIHVKVPFQIPTSDIIRGNEFLLEVKAFGGTQAATLNFQFGVNEDTRKLWVRKEGSSERLTPRELDISPRQEDEQFRRTFDEES